MARVVTDPVAFARCNAVLFLALAALGTALVALDRADVLGAGLFAFDMGHNALHAAFGAVALLSASRPRTAPAFSRVFGGTNAVLGVLGTMSASLYGLGDATGIHMEVGESMLHVAVGAWGLVAGFFALSPSDAPS